MRDMRGIRIILTKDAIEKKGSHSIEAGVANKETGFDHHGLAAGNPAPCADDRIQPIPDGSVIYVTHLDADTFIGVLRMLGLLWIVDQSLVDLVLMGRIDENGATILPDLGRDNTTRQYMVGVSRVAGKLRFPQWNGKDIDVTGIFEKVISYSTKEIIRLGEEKMIQGEKAYQRCKRETFTGGKVIFLCVKTGNSFDGNLALVDGYEAAVLYKERKRSISLRVRSDVDFKIVDPPVFCRVLAGVPFAGHPKATGSRRGKKFTRKQAENVRIVLEYLLRILRTTA